MSSSAAWQACADLGGLAADALSGACQSRGPPKANWRADRGTTEPGGVAAPTRGTASGGNRGQNAKGVVVAKSVEDLTQNSNDINKTDCSD